MLWCSLSYAKIRNMKWLLRRFCTIRGFLYVSMRFYTLGILHEIFEHGSYTRIFWTRIIRITRILFACGSHTDLTLEFFEHESHEWHEFFIAHGSHGSHGSYTRIFWTRIIRITRIIFVHADLTLFNAHGSHRSHGSANASHGSRMTIFVPR